MPKTLISTGFEPGLNVFGIIRADSVHGSSYIHVQKVLTTEQMYSTAEIFDSTVTVQLHDSSSRGVDIFKSNNDPLFQGYYFNDNFLARTGHTYRLTVDSEILPTLTAITVVPQSPKIETNSLQVGNEQAEFRIRATTDSYQYNCYLFFGNNYLERQYLNDGNEPLMVRFDISGQSASPDSLVIIAYDKNLRDYSNATPSFIPQTFHEMVITVENGYGCFGSLAKTTIKF